MTVFVDSNVILDVVSPSSFAAWSMSAISDAAQSGRLVLNVLVYAEVSVNVARIEEMTVLLPDTAFLIEDIPVEAAYLAGKAYAAYRRRGGAKVAPLPDFFIGAHALVQGYTLLTRDATRFRTYFPALKLIAPA